MTFSAPSGQGGRNWHELFLLVISGVYALGGLVTGKTSQAIDAALPGWAQICWYAGLLLGSGMAIAGIAMGTITGLLLEQAAMRTLAGLSAAYIFAALTTAPVGRVTTALGVSYVVAFGLANVARSRQIRAIVGRVRERIQDHGADAGEAS